MSFEKTDFIPIDIPFPSFEEEIESASSDLSVFKVMASVLRHLRYPYCSFIIRMPLPISNRRFIGYNTFPCGWRHLPQWTSVEHQSFQDASTSSGVALQHTEDFGEKTDNLKVTDDLGIKVSWAKSIHTPNGASGTLILGDDDIATSEPLSPSTYIVVDHLLSVSHQKMTDILFKRMIPEAMAKFTNRELEVLRWTSEGKTSYEIGIILGVSTATVNFHVKHLVEKLGSTNRIHAAVKATALGVF